MEQRAEREEAEDGEVQKLNRRDYENGNTAGGRRRRREVQYLCCVCASLIKRRNVCDDQQEGTNTSDSV